MRVEPDDGTAIARSNDRRYTLFTDLPRDCRKQSGLTNCKRRKVEDAVASSLTHVINNDFSVHDGFLALTECVDVVSLRGFLRHERNNANN